MDHIKTFFVSVWANIINYAFLILNYILAHPFLTFLYILLFFIALKVLQLFFLAIRDIYVARKNKKKANESVATATSFLGNVIGISGDKGVGKTSMTSALTTAFELSLSSMAQQKKEFIALLFKVPLLALDAIINDVMIDNDYKYTNEKDFITEKVEEKIKNYMYDNKKQDYFYFNDRIKSISFKEYLQEYVECFLLLNRNNFVYCNVDFKSEITGSKAYHLNLDDVKIKDRFLNRDFKLRRYSVFFNDEGTLNDNNTNINWQKKYKNMEDGEIEHLRLYRHLYRETSKYITTLQHFKRNIKPYRELTDCVLEILDKREIYNKKTFMKLIQWGLFWNNFLLSIKEKTTRKKKRNFNKQKRYGLYHKIQRFLILNISKLDNDKYMLYTAKYYRGSENSELKNSEGEISMLWPAQWCFSPTDPYYFSFMYDALLHATNKEPSINPPLKTNKDKIERMQKVLSSYKHVKNNNTKKNIKIKYPSVNMK